MSGVIKVQPIKRNPRAGWAKDSRSIAEAGGDAPVWPEFGNEADAELVSDDDGS